MAVFAYVVVTLYLGIALLVQIESNRVWQNICNDQAAHIEHLNDKLRRQKEKGGAKHEKY